MLGPVLFNIFVKELEKGAGCTLSKFAVDTKLGGVAGMPEGCTAHSGAQRNVMKFSVRKCEML